MKKEGKKEVSIVFLLGILIAISSYAVSAELNLTVNAKINNLSADFVAQTFANASIGYDGYDLNAPTLPDSYNQLYSAIPGKQLAIDSWNMTTRTRNLNLTHYVSSTEPGWLNISWSFSDSDFGATLTDYGYDSTFTTANSSAMDMKINSGYNASINGSKRYFLMVVTNAAPLINFTSQTTALGNFSQSSISANVSATDGDMDTIIINLYNQTGLVVSNTSTTSPFFWNISNLADGTYYLNATANDSAANINNTGTRTIVLDTTPPTITNVLSGSITSSSATITWNTNESVNSTVYYGTSSSNLNLISNSEILTTSHSISLSSLSAGTTYYYKARSSDALGNIANSSIYNFTTSSIVSEGTTNTGNGGGGGGGGGGSQRGTALPEWICEPEFVCSEWTDCRPDNTIKRVCRRTDNCAGDYKKPNEARYCLYIPTCYNKMKDSDETETDCGGSCKPCGDAPITEERTEEGVRVVTVKSTGMFSLVGGAFGLVGDYKVGSLILLSVLLSIVLIWLFVSLFRRKKTPEAIKKSEILNKTNKKFRVLKIIIKILFVILILAGLSFGAYYCIKYKSIGMDDVKRAYDITINKANQIMHIVFSKMSMIKQQYFNGFQESFKNHAWNISWMKSFFLKPFIIVSFAVFLIIAIVIISAVIFYRKNKHRIGLYRHLKEQKKKGL